MVVMYLIRMELNVRDRRTIVEGRLIMLISRYGRSAWSVLKGWVDLFHGKV